MRDQHHDLTVRSVLAPAVRDADAAGTVIDRSGYGSVTYAIHTGVGGITFTGTNKISYLLEHSDDNSAWSAVAADDVVGVTPASGVVRAITSAHADPSVTQLGYIGSKRYTRLTADFGGTHSSGTPLAVTATLGHPRTRPA